MADSLNDNKVYVRYDHFKNGDRQWSTDTSCNCLPGPGNSLTGMVKVFVLRHRFSQNVLAASHHNRQGPNG